MKSRLLSAAAVAIVASAVAAPAHATVTPKYGYIDFAGATQVNALGLAVQSNPTANSAIIGTASQSKSANIASAQVGSLLGAGVATTDTSAVVNDNGGVTVVAHAKTAGVSLLGGLIKADAVESTATITADGTNAPTTLMTTKLLGLTIGGKAYPADFAPNSGILLPGVVSIGLNTQATGTTADEASIQGAGLKITLLAARNGADAGATVMINPLSQLLEPAPDPNVPGSPLGGTAYGSYIHAAVTGVANVETTHSAQVTMIPTGTNGVVKANNLARVTVSGLLNLGTVHSEQSGVRDDTISKVSEKSTIASLSLLNGLITATALSTTSQAQATAAGAVTTGGSMTFLGLHVAGKAIPVNVAPNTTIHVLNLGEVTLNERKVINQAGLHSYRTTALHIVLDTARAGLPIGAEIELGVSEARVYR
ncbi:choice-of-anchor P family protein [Nocardioides montaniterrae]